MSWTELPPGVIEKIIGFAVKGDKKESEPNLNWYALRVYEYGKVHPTWKEAILSSRNIFQSNLEHEQAVDQSVFIAVGGDGRIVMPRQFIEDGYLQAVKVLTFWFEGSSRDFDLQFLYDSIAARNSVEHFSIIIGCQVPEKVERQIIQLVKRLKKMNFFMTTVQSLESQAQAEWLWQVMRVVIHTTSLPKKIHFNYEDTSNLIDWSFINRDERLDVGSIKRLVATCNTPLGFFDKLATIDTLVVGLGVEFWRQKNRFVEGTKAKRLVIECGLDLDAALVSKLRNDNSRRAFTVDTIECLVGENGNYPVPSPRTFENDVEVWEKIKDWLLPIVDNYRLFNEVEQ